MAWAPDYCTAAELKTHLRIADTDDDTPLGIAITAASRAVDRATSRQFGSTSSQSRYYVHDGAVYGRTKRPLIAIDDVQTTSGLTVVVDNDNDATYELTLTNDDDFDLWPFNAALNGVPWTHLILREGSSVLAAFPIYERSIKVTASFGWTAVPASVKQATLIQAARFFQRRESPYGVAGSPDLGSEMRLLDRLDPDVATLLRSLQRRWGAV